MQSVPIRATLFNYHVMRIYRIQQILADARVAVEENYDSSPVALTRDPETLALDEIVRDRIVEAVRRVHVAAPVRLLDGGNNLGQAVYWMDDHSGWMLLPDDFLRLVVFRMDDWRRDVYTLLPPTAAEYKLQSSKIQGIRGTADRPLCFETMRPEGRVMEFYGTKDRNARVSKGVYLPYPKIDKFGGVGICERCYQAVVYMTGALTMMNYGAADRGKLLIELSNSAMI